MNDSLLDVLADDSLEVHADGSANFGGVVSSREFTADTIQQGSTAGEGLSLRLGEILGGSSVNEVRFHSGGSPVARITGSTDAIRLRKGFTVGPTLSLEEEFGEIVLRPTGTVKFDGDNLSTSATTGLGPDRYLTVNTTAGLRKVPLYQT